MTINTDTSRLDITFRSGGSDCAAWLYLPASRGPFPTIVMGHGLGGIRQMRLDAFAERFQAAGYACLVFDYRHFGARAASPASSSISTGSSRTGRPLSASPARSRVSIRSAWSCGARRSAAAT
jgi:cephalosporin-C deacetylase-like acetyl esterase